jgi:hypothetical protein
MCICRIPALTRARNEMARPRTVIAAAEISGTHRDINKLSPFKADMNRPA